MFTMSNKSDYGLILLSQLKKEDKYVPMSVLVEKTDLPQRFIARIASDLVKHGVLKSKEGKVGGYKLAKTLDQVQFLDFLKIFEKNICIVKCNDEEYKCRYEKICMHKSYLNNFLVSVFKKQFKDVTLEDVFNKGQNGS